MESGMRFFPEHPDFLHTLETGMCGQGQGLVHSGATKDYSKDSPKTTFEESLTPDG